MHARSSSDSVTAGNRQFRSLEYGLGLLRQFTAAHPERGVTELARELHISAPTAHRYASTCLELGYLEQVATRRYRLTRRSARPGMALLSSLRLSRCARPILRELRAQTGRTVCLAVLDGDEVVYLKRLCGWRRGQYRLEKGLAGVRPNAADTAAGIALLADEPEPGKGTRRRTRARTGAAPRTLAIAVRTPPGEPRGAIELVVAEGSPTLTETLAELDEPLLTAGAALEGALNGGRPVADARERPAETAIRAG